MYNKIQYKSYTKKINILLLTLYLFSTHVTSFFSLAAIFFVAWPKASIQRSHGSRVSSTQRGVPFLLRGSRSVAGALESNGARQYASTRMRFWRQWSTLWHFGAPNCWAVVVTSWKSVFLFDMVRLLCLAQMLGDPTFCPYDKQTLQPKWEAWVQAVS